MRKTFEWWKNAVNDNILYLMRSVGVICPIQPIFIIRCNMSADYPYELRDDPNYLAEFGEWGEEVYRDFRACQSGQMTEAEFRNKYLARRAILVLDMTGFTESAKLTGELNSMLRIYDVQKVCAPVFAEYGASLVHAFADDLTVIFDDAGTALDTAFEIHRRIQVFNNSNQAGQHPAECAVGIGYGDVFTIGPNKAMGDEMNMASKLGEDTARGRETLVTVQVYEALKHRSDCKFVLQSADDLIFPYYAAFKKK